MQVRKSTLNVKTSRFPTAPVKARSNLASNVENLPVVTLTELTFPSILGNLERAGLHDRSAPRLKRFWRAREKSERASAVRPRGHLSAVEKGLCSAAWIFVHYGQRYQEDNCIYEVLSRGLGIEG